MNVPSRRQAEAEIGHSDITDRNVGVALEQNIPPRDNAGARTAITDPVPRIAIRIQKCGQRAVDADVVPGLEAVRAAAHVPALFVVEGPAFRADGQTEPALVALCRGEYGQTADRIADAGPEPVLMAAVPVGIFPIGDAVRLHYKVSLDPDGQISRRVRGGADRAEHGISAHLIVHLLGIQGQLPAGRIEFPRQLVAVFGQLPIGGDVIGRAAGSGITVELLMLAVHTDPGPAVVIDLGIAAGAGEGPRGGGGRQIELDRRRAGLCILRIVRPLDKDRLAGIDFVADGGQEAVFLPVRVGRRLGIIHPAVDLGRRGDALHRSPLPARKALQNEVGILAVRHQGGLQGLHFPGQVDGPAAQDRDLLLRQLERIHPTDVPDLNVRILHDVQREDAGLIFFPGCLIEPPACLDPPIRGPYTALRQLDRALELVVRGQQQIAVGGGAVVVQQIEGIVCRRRGQPDPDRV